MLKHESNSLVSFLAKRALQDANSLIGKNLNYMERLRDETTGQKFALSIFKCNAQEQIVIETIQELRNGMIDNWEKPEIKTLIDFLCIS